jgi:hypothetical protein
VNGKNGHISVETFIQLGVEAKTQKKCTGKDPCSSLIWPMTIKIGERLIIKLMVLFVSMAKCSNTVSYSNCTCPSQEVNEVLKFFVKHFNGCTVTLDKTG